MRKMRAVAFATRLIDNGELDAPRHSRMLIHWIGNAPLMSELGTAAQCHRDEGREAAAQWLTERFDAIGVRSTVNEMFL